MDCEKEFCPANMTCDKCPARFKICDDGDKGDWWCQAFWSILTTYIEEVKKSSVSQGITVDPKEGYRALVRRWIQQAQCGANTDDERHVYEQCAMSLHDLNIQVEGN